MSMVDYSDLEQEIQDAPEPRILNAGEQVMARIISVNTGISESEKYDGCQWFSVLFDVPEDPVVSMFNDFFWLLDKDKLPNDAFIKELYHTQTFAAAFGIDLSQPFSWTDDLNGKEGAIIGGQSKDKQSGDMRSAVKKYLKS